MPSKHILLLTTTPADTPSPTTQTLSAALSEAGIPNTIASWHTTPAPQYTSYTHILLLTTSPSHQYPESFLTLLHTLQQLEPPPVILNPVSAALWNANKTYLTDLGDAGLTIPATTFLSAAQPPGFVEYALLNRDDAAPCVVKPSLRVPVAHPPSQPASPIPSATPSGSARSSASSAPSAQSSAPSTQTASSSSTWRLIEDPRQLSPADKSFLEGVGEAQPNAGGSIMLQEYLSEARDGGVCKAVLVGGELVGAFRDGPDVSREIVRLDAVEAEAVRKVQEFLQSKFGDLAYARVDGVRRRDAFVVMGVELIDPDLGLEHSDFGPGVRDALVRCVAKA